MTWYYYNTPQEFTEEDIGEAFGFVYLITHNSTGKKYIGKKFFTKSKTKQVKGKKKKTRVSREERRGFVARREEVFPEEGRERAVDVEVVPLEHRAQRGGKDDEAVLAIEGGGVGRGGHGNKGCVGVGATGRILSCPRPGQPSGAAAGGMVKGGETPRPSGHSGSPGPGRNSG